MHSAVLAVYVVLLGLQKLVIMESVPFHSHLCISHVPRSLTSTILFFPCLWLFLHMSESVLSLFCHISCK